MFTTLVFDFDGLILDSESPEYEAWLEQFNLHGAKLPLDVWIQCVGRAPGYFDPIKYLEDQIGRKVDGSRLKNVQRKKFHELIEGSKALPGVEQYIADAKKLGLRIGLASSASRDWAEGQLKRLELFDAFDCIRTRESVKHAKPEPDLYLCALKALDASPGQAIAFEDSPNGIEAAKRAGIFCVAVTNPITQAQDVSKADLRLGSLADMPLQTLLKEAESRVE
jgi:HAD superfamily hydrolase (TIGR01509 family)